MNAFNIKEEGIIHKDTMPKFGAQRHEAIKKKNHPQVKMNFKG